MDTPSFLRKITAPALPVTIVHRTTLVQRLCEILVGRAPGAVTGNFLYKLVLIQAPAGYGKTTLLTEVALQSSFACCWYILDHSDSEPLLFLRLLLASLRQRFPSFGEQLVPLLGETAMSSDKNYPYRVLDALLDTISHEIHERFAILLCHYQEVNEYAEVTGLVEYFLNHLPPQGTLVLESREVPAFDFASLLASRSMIGIGQDLLRFSAQEIRELAHLQGSQDLTEAEARQLAVAFDGWITGLLLGTQLGGIEFLRYRYIAPFVHETQGIRIDAQNLFSYVVNEIFKRHQEMYTFLKEAVVLQEMTPELCAALLGMSRVKASHYLHYLEQHGLFVTHCGDKAHQIYICHPVLRDLLYKELRQHHYERFIQLHQHAVEVLNRDQRYELAIYHALEASMYEIAARLIITQAEQIIEQGHLERLQHWILAFPDEVTFRYPRLLLILANMYLKKSELPRVEPLLEQIAEILTGQLPTLLNKEDLPVMQAELAIARANAAIQQGKYEQAQELCQQVLERLPVDETTLRAYAHIYLGACAQFLGDFMTKLENYQKALQICGRHTISYLTADGHNSLADAYRMLGRFTLAEHHSERARACWDRLQNIPGMINNLIVRAEIKRDQGHLGETESLLQQALVLASNPVPLYRLQAYVLISQGELYQEQGLYDRALAVSDEGLALARQLGDSYLLNSALSMLAQTYLYIGDAVTARLLISELTFEGSVEAAGRSIQQIGRDLVMGSIRMYQGALVEAQSILERTEKMLGVLGLRREQLRALVFLAACYLKQKQWRETFLQLERIEQILGTFDGYEQRVLTEMRVCPALQREIRRRSECATLRSLLHWERAEEDLQENQHEVGFGGIDREPSQKSVPVPALAWAEMSTVSRLEIQAFGEPMVQLNGMAVTRWRMAKGMELCFYLLECKQPMRKEQIISALWEQMDEQTSQTFYSTIHYVRKALGGEATLKSRGGTYALDLASIYGPPGSWYDVAAFEELYARGKQALAKKADEEAYQAFLSMVDLYRGDYVQPFYSDWCSLRRDELRRAYLDARQQLAQITWQSEAIEESATHWQQMLAIDSCLEEAHRGLMRCYIRLGKRGLALRQYQRCTQALQQELGTHPGVVTQRLYQQLVKQSGASA